MVVCRQSVGFFLYIFSTFSLISVDIGYRVVNRSFYSFMFTNNTIPGVILKIQCAKRQQNFQTESLYSRYAQHSAHLITTSSQWHSHRGGWGG